MGILEKSKREAEGEERRKPTKRGIKIAKEERPSRCERFDRVHWSSDTIQEDIISDL